jgi:methylase of polypeptide subunit release factors
MLGSMLVQRLTREGGSWDFDRQLNDFASELGWRPSDKLKLPFCREFSTGHLLVEHGLEYTAVISFLTSPYTFATLDVLQQKALVSASYNNLIDWSINVDFEGVSFVYNRYRRPEFHVVREPLTENNMGVLSTAHFRRITHAKPAPNVPALDRAVVDTISLWKRELGGQFVGISNTAISALFNAILLVRAAEDNLRYQTETNQPPILPLVAADLRAGSGFTLQRTLAAAISRLELRNIPSDLIDLGALSMFDPLDSELGLELINDFYQNRFSRYYDFDFSLMSKHALSRIYEHYVSILRIPTSDQEALFPRVAIEENERSYGNIYTPEFIAKFFARYLRQLLPLRSFERLTVADPACGSGIFLRAFLELQNETIQNNRTTEAIRSTFLRVSGVDIDENACRAAKLSLSLLSMLLIGEFPEKLDIISADVLQYFLDYPELREVYDVVVANPPYVKIEAQTLAQRERAAEVLGDDSSGRSDLYLAILKLSLLLIKPGGFGLFVLPETFLKAESARKVRASLASMAWIHAIVDLTAIEIFPEMGVYSILIIFERKAAYPALLRTAKILQCRGNIAEALQDLLDDRVVDTPFYSIYEVDQDAFGEEWSLAPPSVARLLRKLEQYPSIEEQFTIRQGMNTGADDVFILDRARAVELGDGCFLPLLTDREMERYTIPELLTKAVFYPYLGEKLVDEETLRQSFPLIWNYLSQFKEALGKRASVVRGDLPWWRPERPRAPKEMLRPKIVTPHLVVAARFALDTSGEVAVSRSPIIFSKLGKKYERDHLLYLLGVLNSSLMFWDISRRSHVYSRGYSRLEKATFRGLRIPDFSLADQRLVKAIVKFTESRLRSSGNLATDLEREIDLRVAQLYNLSEEEQNMIGLDFHEV